MQRHHDTSCEYCKKRIFKNEELAREHLAGIHRGDPGQMRRLIRSAVLLLSVLSAHASTHRSGVVGIASWYGLQHHGRNTASGQRFNEHDLDRKSTRLN